MNVNLFIHKLYSSLLKRSGKENNKKSRQHWLDRKYNNQPLISFIIQSHNKSEEVKHIAAKLRHVPNCEIIVIDDGSTSYHTKALIGYLQGINEFVIRANDLYENVMYDRAIRLAKGEYLALLQDDDDFEDLTWVDQAVNYFSKYPQLVILGGYGGFDLEFGDSKVSQILTLYKKNTDKDFSFVRAVNRAPMWINKSLFFEKLKSIDYNFAPFQYDDTELCIRAWLNGLQVGWYNAGFQSLTAGGMRIWNSQFIKEQDLHNSKLLYDLYKDKKDLLDTLVNEANSKCNG